MGFRLIDPDDLERMMVDKSHEKYILCLLGDGAEVFVGELENLFFAPGTPSASEFELAVGRNRDGFWETWVIVPRTKENLRRIVYVAKKLGLESYIGRIVNDMYPEIKRELEKKGGKRKGIKQESTGERKRDPIPTAVQKEVWDRDGGRCVSCGSVEKIHFDHIIPVSKGGSNFTGNIQILCQKCNLRKGPRIGGDERRENPPA